MKRVSLGEKILTIERPLNGWAVDFTTGSTNTTAVRGSAGQYSQSRALSLHRLGRVGALAPGETFTAITDASGRITELPLNAVVASTGRAFSVLRNARLVSFVPGTDSVDAYYDVAAAAPNHAGHVVATSDNQDVFVYKESGGSERVLVSWEDDNDADVMRINPDGTGQDDDFFSTRSGGAVLSKAVPHMFFRSGINNYIHVTNGQYSATFDIVSDSVNVQAFPSGPGWVQVSACQYGNYAAIVGYQATSYLTGAALGAVRVWIWDGASADAAAIYDIADNYATSIVNDNGILKVFCKGRNGTVKPWIFNKVYGRFEPGFESGQIGDPPKHGGVALFQEMVHFAATSGNCEIGVLDGAAYHQRAYIVDSGLSLPLSVGLFKELRGGVPYVGAKTGASAWKIYFMNLAGYYPGATFRSLLLDFGYKSRILWFKVYFAQFGTGASLQMAFMKEGATESFGGAADKLNRTLTNAALGNVSEYFFRQEIDDITAGYLSLKFNHSAVTDAAAIVDRIEIGFRPIYNRL